MATLRREGCLVSVPATYFDILGTPHEDKWSVATFGRSGIVKGAMGLC